MRKMINRACSFFLLLAMVLCIGVPAYAVENAEIGNYAVLISQDQVSTVRVGGTIYLAVTANKYFDATEILIKYDDDKLTFDGIYVGEGNLSATATVDGYVKLIDYGSHTDTPRYVLQFDVLDMVASTPTAPAYAEFEVIEAGFGTIETAATQNLIPAILPEKALSIEIRPELVEVTYDSNGFYTQYDLIEKGSDLVIYPEQVTGGYYDYDLPVVTVGGVPAAVNPVADGGWKIENVSGPVVVAKAERTPKSYGNVVYNDVSSEPVITNKTTYAVYLSDVTFTIPANLAPTETKNGYEYSVTATIGGQSYTLATPNVGAQGNRTYTIPGADVKGAVVITVTKTDLEPTKYTVSIGGSASSDAKFEGAEGFGASIQVDKTGTASAVLNINCNVGLNKGYHYTVTVDGVAMEIDANGQVVINNIKSNMQITVEKVLNIDGVTNVVKINGQEKNFLTMDDQYMWLIQLPNHVGNTTTATYKYASQDMFWSEDHNNFVCVVISDAKPDIDVNQFELVSVFSTSVIRTNDWDVNKSGDLDASDAQLIWNMYNDQYQGFSNDITPEKFLLADANHDGVLDTMDASVIINQIRASLELD